jgi:hypothetical protein
VHSEPILEALARGEGERLDRTLRDLVTALLPEDAAGPRNTASRHP